MPAEELARVLIYCKTYPELSRRNKETVCTAGVFLPSGRPVRLYPVPLRYLPDSRRYRLYDVVEVPVRVTPSDPRPESRRPDFSQLRVIDHIQTDKRWEAREELIFKYADWHYECVEQLRARQLEDNTSLGCVPVASVDAISIVARTSEEREKHETKAAAQAAVIDLFDQDSQRELAFLPNRIRVKWRCGHPGEPHPECPTHTASILDWGLLELARRDGWEKARERMEDIADLSRHDLHFFMGNFFTHPRTFGIVGMWYPPLGPWRAQTSLKFDL